MERIAEDARGLRVIARIDRPRSRAAALLRARAVSGLSFGYRAREFRRSAAGRMLEEVELFEISLVTHPLQPGATPAMYCWSKPGRRSSTLRLPPAAAASSTPTPACAGWC